MRTHKIALVAIVLSLNYTVYSQCDGQATFTDARDGQTYNMIQIDGSNAPYCLGSSQCWMAENLNIGTFLLGNTAQTSGADNQDASIERYCYDDVNPGNCDTYGGIYQWDEMMAYGTSVSGNGPGPRGICPVGWHLPTDNEWKCLDMNLGMTQAQADATGYRGTDQGDQLKDNVSWDGTNTSGFTALHGGTLNFGGPIFSGENNFVLHWSATESTATRAWYRILSSSEARAFQNTIGKEDGNYVRCIRDVAAIPLPVELLFFEANWTDERYTSATLNWETISERNNSHFEIERSIDAIDFKHIKTVSGNETSNQNIQYTTLDENPYTGGTSYYRLKQVDNNGHFEYSNIEALNISEGIDLVNLYPNPMVKDLTVLLTSSIESKTIVSIKNAIGQEVARFDQNIEKGFNSLNFNLSSLGSGNYFFEITTETGLYKVEQKFVKAK